MSELLKELEEKIRKREQKKGKPLKRPLPKRERPIVQIMQAWIDKPRPIETFGGFLYQLMAQKLAYIHEGKLTPLKRGEKPDYAV